ncbi:MAG: RNA polymerase sigma factor [Lachnospiraceae bacterium]|nr:RNA polymerase sigma factor [Lachnospiraceae bacterium]
MKYPEKQYERDSFAAIYDAYYDRIYKYAFTLLLNREDAEDVTADTFFAAYANISTYDPEKASMRTWLTRIAHNRAVNLVRSAAYSKREDLPEVPEDPGYADPAGQIAAAETVARLYALLKPEERELLNMRCIMELKDREIGELMHLPEKTVNKRYNRLLKKCRIILENGI